MKLTEQVWQIWFILSIIMLAMLFFIGTLPNSIESFPYWPYGMTAAFINAVIVTIKGFESYDEES